ncbi:MAG TPA: uracil-DNA glycosylase [Xanthobacteraceae bacterium]|nr:uracil-DNA glycosylase [Xanthobacteraceae bacterium]
MTFGRKEARELIAFYLDAGADALLGEAPVDRMADEATPPPERGRLDGEAVQVGVSGRNGTDPAPDRRSLPSGGAERRPVGRSDPPPAGEGVLRAAPPPSPDAAMMAAREAARTAASLDDLRKLLDSFEGCALRATATQLVFADGNPQARVMFVGEAPGYEEDISGKPFVGRSGKLLDRMMAAIGLDRGGAYIANVVPWRPPGNRTPTPQETAICLPFIRRQIELANPDVLVCLGGPAAQTLLGTKDGITRTRGRWFPYDTGTREIRALATFHPAFLLRSPLQKRFAWRDFLAIKKALGA